MCKRFALTLFCLALICPNVISSSYTWLPCQEDGFDHWLFLYKGDEHIGGYDRKSRQYRNIVDPGSGKWSAATQPPHPVPNALKGYEEVSQNFGVDLSKIGQGGYRYQGKEITKEMAFELVKNANLEDDSHMHRLTVIGDKSLRDQVIGDFQQLTPDVKKDLIVTQYDPEHWHVDGVFQSPIYVQEPDGVVLARMDAYPGPELFATVLRKTNPNYDPSKDPTEKDFVPRRFTVNLANIPMWFWLVLGNVVVLVIAVILARKR